MRKEVIAMGAADEGQWDISLALISSQLGFQMERFLRQIHFI